MKIIENILTLNDCYKSGRKIAVKGLMIHSVGCPQPSAGVFLRQWNKSGVAKCVHAFLEPNGDVYQTLPWNHRGWHAGGVANNTHIGVEMTEPATIKYTSGASWRDLDPAKTKAHVMATYKVAVDLFAHLCKMYKLDPLANGVIISHSEGYKKGIASGHADVEHIWARYGMSMVQFRKDIKASMGAESELLQAVKLISTKIPGGLDVNGWAGDDKEWKAKYVDTLLIKIASAWKG